MNTKNTAKVFGKFRITTSTTIIDYIKGMTDEEREIFFKKLFQEPYVELDGNTSYLEAYYDYDFEKIDL